MPVKRTPVKAGLDEADNKNPKPQEEEEFGMRRSAFNRSSDRLDLLDEDEDDLSVRERAMKELMDQGLIERACLNEKLEELLKLVGTFQHQQEEQGQGLEMLSDMFKGKAPRDKEGRDEIQDELISGEAFERSKAVQDVIEECEGSRLAAFHKVFDTKSMSVPKMLTNNSKWLANSSTPHKGCFEAPEFLQAHKASQAYAIEFMIATAHALEEAKEFFTDTKWQILRMLFRRNMGVISGTHKHLTSCKDKKSSGEASRFTKCVVKDVKKARQENTVDPYAQMLGELDAPDHEKSLEQKRMFEAIKKTFATQKRRY